MVSQVASSSSAARGHGHHGHHHVERKNSDDSNNSISHAPPFVPLEETSERGGSSDVVTHRPVVVMVQPATNTSSSSTTSTKEPIPGGSKSKRRSGSNTSGSSSSAAGSFSMDEIMARIEAIMLRLRAVAPKEGVGGVLDFAKKYCSLKKGISFFMFFILFLIVWDALFTAPENRWLQPDFSDSLMQWVQVHPMQGWIVLVLTLAIAVIFMIPIGTPITLGCGYIYKGLYGWKLGVFIATIVSMGGSALGAVTCFLLGRYLMRDQVRLWIKKYPLFDAIDIAAAEHGLRIMAMLYLTPILPLGPVSYMCGTTSMALSSFVLAKVASLPLMLLYVFIGASAGALIGSNKKDSSSTTKIDDFKSIEENTTLIVSGILLSFVMIAGITHNIRKELNKILERQEKHKPGEMETIALSSSTTSIPATSIRANNKESTITTDDDGDSDGTNNEDGMELGAQLVRQRRAG